MCWNKWYKKLAQISHSMLLNMKRDFFFLQHSLFEGGSAWKEVGFQNNDEGYFSYTGQKCLFIANLVNICSVVWTLHVCTDI